MSRERDLEERIRQLEEMSDQKDRMLGVVVHELRNPLAAIRSAAEVLRLTLGNEPRVQKTYAIIDRQTMSMVKLLERIGDISKIARGKITLDRARVDLGQVLTRTAERISESLAPNIGLDLLWVDADAARLQQIFECALQGAVRATAEKDAAGVIVAFHYAGAEIDPLSLGLIEGLIALHEGTAALRKDGPNTQLELRLPLAQ